MTRYPYSPLPLFALLISLALWLTIPAYANPVVHINSSDISFSLENKIEWLEDRSGQLDIKDIEQEYGNEQWSNNSESNPNFGFTHSAYWFHTQLINQDKNSVSVSLVLDNPLLDEVSLYSYSAGKLIQTINSDDTKPFLHRPDEHLTFVLPATVPAEKSVSLYLRVRSEGAMQIPMTMWNSDYYHHHEEEQVII